MQVRGHVNSVVLAMSTVPLGPVHHNDAVLHWAADREGSTALDQRRPPPGSRRNAGEGQRLVPANRMLVLISTAVADLSSHLADEER